MMKLLSQSGFIMEILIYYQGMLFHLFIFLCLNIYFLKVKKYY